MKRYLAVGVLCIISLFLGIAISRFILFFSGNYLVKQTQPTDLTSTTDKIKDQIVFPADILNNYTLVKAQTMFSANNKEEFTVIGFAPANFSLEKPDNNKSFLAIYKKSPDGLMPVYKFSPQFADKEIEQTRISFEDMWTEGSNKDSVVTTWSQIGADYFGKYPIVIAYRNGTFTAVPFYSEDLSENPKIKNITWTTKDVIIKNRFDQTNSFKTILVQKAVVENGEIVLSFIGDNECHACEHKYINFTFPLYAQPTEGK